MCKKMIEVSIETLGKYNFAGPLDKIIAQLQSLPRFHLLYTNLNVKVEYSEEGESIMYYLAPERKTTENTSSD